MQSVYESSLCIQSRRDASTRLHPYSTMQRGGTSESPRTTGTDGGVSDTRKQIKGNGRCVQVLSASLCGNTKVGAKVTFQWRPEIRESVKSTGKSALIGTLETRHFLMLYKLRFLWFFFCRRHNVEQASVT